MMETLELIETLYYFFSTLYILVSIVFTKS
jgi:hypothetical protein